MKKSLIKQKYYQKLSTLNYYNKKYYDDNLSDVTDAEYDQLKKELLELEQK